jgi:uncharacterized membrane protein YhaH (DUF805 family)
MEWMLLPYKRYADFTGRSRRKEYWMFTLLYALVTIGLVILMLALGAAAGPGEGLGAGGGLVIILALLFMLGSFIPGLAVQVRRFHDQDKSGWFVLFNFVPYIGSFIVLVFMCIDGTRGDNQYGPDPKQLENIADVFA